MNFATYILAAGIADWDAVEWGKFFKEVVGFVLALGGVILGLMARSKVNSVEKRQDRQGDAVDTLRDKIDSKTIPTDVAMQLLNAKPSEDKPFFEATPEESSGPDETPRQPHP